LTPSAAFHILTIVRGVVLLSLFGVASLLLVAVFAGAAPGGAAADAKPAVDPGVRQTVKSGTAKVLVELRISALKPEGELKPESVKAQRQAIPEGQNRVLSKLANTRFTVARRYQSIPLLALEVGADALAKLEGMTDVVRIWRTAPLCRRPLRAPTGRVRLRRRPAE